MKMSCISGYSALFAKPLPTAVEICVLQWGDVYVNVIAGVITAACRMKAGHVKTAALF